ncbi:hypothetical protein F4779DRAFT_592259 [Xylariaceae sp. FL0662B]|nr:hypothetical protein F4779DRAFT_592259 [Xylariaceae sp. FL0662B]
MSCRMPGCQHIKPDGSRIKLDHQKNTIPGATYYYCCVHRVYHCISQSRRHLQQPSCGECTWLFFQLPKEAIKAPMLDLPIATTAHESIVDGLRNNSMGAPLQGNVTAGLENFGLNGTFPGQGATTIGDPSQRFPGIADSGLAGSVPVVEKDEDGDVVMADNDPVPGASPGIVRLPIRSIPDVSQFIPYDNPAVFDVQPCGWHPKLHDVFLFRYTDINGLPALQPAAD